MTREKNKKHITTYCLHLFYCIKNYTWKKSTLNQFVCVCACICVHVFMKTNNQVKKDTSNCKQGTYHILFCVIYCMFWSFIPANIVFCQRNWLVWFSSSKEMFWQHLNKSYPQVTFYASHLQLMYTHTYTSLYKYSIFKRASYTDISIFFLSERECYLWNGLVRPATALPNLSYENNMGR